MIETISPLASTRKPATYASPRSASRAARYRPGRGAPSPAASNASDDTAYSGHPTAAAMPLAIEAAMRKLVKLPGPAPHTTRERSRTETPARESPSTTAGINASDSRPRMVASASASTTPSRNTAVVPTYVDASRTRVITRDPRTFARRRAHRRRADDESDRWEDAAGESGRDRREATFPRARATRRARARVTRGCRPNRCSRAHGDREGGRDRDDRRESAQRRIRARA